jgi:hypothetical protein
MNFLAYFCKNSLILDTLIAIDVDIFISSDGWIGQKGGECRKFNILTLLVPILPYAVYQFQRLPWLPPLVCMWEAMAWFCEMGLNKF